MAPPFFAGSNGLTLFPFLLEERTPSDECSCAEVFNPIGRWPTLLNLFPLMRAVKSSNPQKDSIVSLVLRSFSRDSSIAAVARREGRSLCPQSADHDPTSPLLKYPDSGYVCRNKSPVQMPMMRDVQGDLPMLTYGAPSIGQFQLTGHVQVSPPSANSPVQDLHVTSSKDKGKGKMVETDGGPSNFGPDCINLSYCESMMMAPGNSNGPSESASSLMAALPNHPSMAANLMPPHQQHLMEVPHLDAEGVGTSISKKGRKPRKPRKHSKARGKRSAEHEPQTKSSRFKGVGLYKRTERWDARIWHKGTQLSLGSSVSEEQAARHYDRATIHFRGMNAELNYPRTDYTMEIQQLMEVSDSKLVEILRKQSYGEGTEFPDYPPLREQQQ